MQINHPTEIADTVIFLNHLINKAFGKPFQFNSVITPLAFYIMLLLKSKEPLSMTQLSEELGIPKPNITGLADKLIENRFAERIPDNHDRRKVMIALTKKGYDFLESTQDSYQKKIKTKLEVLTEKEMEHFTNALLVVKNSLAILQTI